MNELRPELDRQLLLRSKRGRMPRENSAADAIARLDDAHALTGLRQQPTRSQSSGARADYDDVEFFIIHERDNTGLQRGSTWACPSSNTH
jgi:hypothetical protein